MTKDEIEQQLRRAAIKPENRYMTWGGIDSDGGSLFPTEPVLVDGSNVFYAKGYSLIVEDEQERKPYKFKIR